MIGVDTNVLVRLFITEEPQSTKSKVFFAARSPMDPALVSLVVMAEFAWVLKKKYKQGFEQIAQVIASMLDSNDFVIEGRDRVEWALANYTRSRIDFSDLLIARSNELAGAPRTTTFDGDASKYVPGMELLK
jgi:predicted nucleic-acid-binding protein